MPLSDKIYRVVPVTRPSTNQRPPTDPGEIPARTCLVLTDLPITPINPKSRTVEGLCKQDINFSSDKHTLLTIWAHPGTAILDQGNWIGPGFSPCEFLAGVPCYAHFLDW